METMVPPAIPIRPTFRIRDLKIKLAGQTIVIISGCWEDRDRTLFIRMTSGNTILSPMNGHSFPETLIHRTAEATARWVYQVLTTVRRDGMAQAPGKTITGTSGSLADM